MRRGPRPGGVAAVVDALPEGGLDDGETGAAAGVMLMKPGPAISVFSMKSGGRQAARMRSARARGGGAGLFGEDEGDGAGDVAVGAVTGFFEDDFAAEFA